MVVQASTAYGNDNRYVADAVRAHPDRFGGVFSVDVLADDNVSQMQRWLDAGLSGLRIFTTGTTMPGQADWLDDERTFPVWEYAQRHHISICIQMTAAGIPKLVRLLTRFPDVRVLLDHLARPDLAGGPPYESAAPLFGLANHAGVHLKLTNRTVREAARGASTPEAFFRVSLPPSARHASRGARTTPPPRGRSRRSWREARNGLSMLSDADRAWIFGDTARTIYPLLADVPTRRHDGVSPDTGVLHLRTVLKRYPHTAKLITGEISDPRVRLDCVEVEPIYRAFAPMARAQVGTTSVKWRS
jgi:predicted TIM-barrel fold metal-dependent hydrolase